MNRKELINKCESYLEELKGDHGKHLDFYDSLKTQYYKDEIPRPFKKIEIEFNYHIELLNKLKIEDSILIAEDYKTLYDLYNISIEYRGIGEKIIEKMTAKDLYLFIFGLLYSFRGDWNDVELRVAAFNNASEKLLKLIGKTKKEELERLMNKVASFEMDDYCRDGRIFRFNAPQGYYGAFDYLNTPGEKREFSKNVKDALTFYCQYFNDENYIGVLNHKEK